MKIKSSSRRKKIKILNIGCGEEFYGTDFVDLYPSRSEVKKCDISKEELPFPNNTFDEVYSRNLLEHLPNPLHFFKESKRVLKKGGKLVVMTDHANYWVWSLPNKSHSGRYEGHGKTDKHFALFTEHHLKNYCKLFNLKIKEIKYLTRDVKNLKHALRFIIDKFIQQTPFKKMGYYMIKIVAIKN